MLSATRRANLLLHVEVIITDTSKRGEFHCEVNDRQVGMLNYSVLQLTQVKCTYSANSGCLKTML